MTELAIYLAWKTSLFFTDLINLLKVVKIRILSKFTYTQVIQNQYNLHFDIGKKITFSSANANNVMWTFHKL